MTQSSSTASSQRSRSASRPTCTHLEMSRIWVDEGTYCPHCGRLPLLGFLYECRQDYMPVRMPLDISANLAPTTTTKPRKKLVPKGKKRISPAPSVSKHVSRPDIEAFNLSPWITQAIKEGHYTPEQVEVIKAQRVNVLTTIVTNAMSGSESMHSATPPAKRQHDDHSSLKPPGGSSGPSHKTKIHATNAPQPPGGCDFRCCATCRPLSRDRAYASFEDALTKQSLEHFTELERDSRSMRVHDVELMRGLGTRKPIVRFPSFDSEEEETTPAPGGQIVHISDLGFGPTVHVDYPVVFGRSDTGHRDEEDEDMLDEEEDEYVEARTDRTLSRQTSRYCLPHIPEHTSIFPESSLPHLRPSSSSVGFSEALKSSLKEMIQRHRSEASYKHGTDHFDEEIERISQACENGEEFDVHLWRELSERLLVRAAQTRLPDEDETDEFSRTPAETKGARMKTETSANADASLGPELTEEAIETHSPDVITQV